MPSAAGCTSKVTALVRTATTWRRVTSASCGNESFPKTRHVRGVRGEPVRLRSRQASAWKLYESENPLVGGSNGRERTVLERGVAFRPPPPPVIHLPCSPAPGLNANR